MSKILMKGNEAVAEAAIRAGCRLYFAYPITPQSELIEYMAKMMPKVNGVFLQAESEVSAINMVYGAAGVRKARDDVLLLAGHFAQTGRNILYGWRAIARCGYQRLARRSGPGRHPARSG